MSAIRKVSFLKNWKKRFLLLFLFCLSVFLLPFAAEAASLKTQPPALKVKKKETQAVLSWTKKKSLTGYQVFSCNKKGGSRRLLKTTRGSSYTVKNLKKGKTYYYRLRGYKKKGQKTYYTPYGKVVSVKIQKAKKTVKPKSTIKKFLQIALQPVGSTMYVWGGGWNKADTGAGKEARTIGVSPRWKAFFKKQNKNYNYRKTRYQISNGLDCSGYVGWCVYNAMNTTSGKEGYVMKAEKMAKNFASRGWGTYNARSRVRNYRAGDIRSSSCSDCGHVWIVVGECKDGSVVILHSSPPGVQLAGTPTPSGKKNSQAVKLAARYMKKYYPKWYKKYPNCAKGSSYLKHYAQMRWNVSGNSVFTDPDGYRSMTADEILKDLF